MSPGPFPHDPAMFQCIILTLRTIFMRSLRVGIILLPDFFYFCLKFFSGHRIFLNGDGSKILLFFFRSGFFNFVINTGSPNSKLKFVVVTPGSWRFDSLIVLLTGFRRTKGSLWSPLFVLHKDVPFEWSREFYSVIRFN